MSGEKQDERWGDYLPTFLRIRGLALTGDCSQFLARISQRLSRYFSSTKQGFPTSIIWGLSSRQKPYSVLVLGDVVAYVNLLDQRVLDSGNGPGHALCTSGDLFPNRMGGFEGLRPKAR